MDGGGFYFATTRSHALSYSQGAIISAQVQGIKGVDYSAFGKTIVVHTDKRRVIGGPVSVEAASPGQKDMKRVKNMGKKGLREKQNI